MEVMKRISMNVKKSKMRNKKMKMKKEKEKKKKKNKKLINLLQNHNQERI